MYSTEQRIFRFSINIIGERRFPDGPVPNKKTIYTLVKKINETGSVQNKKRSVNKRVLTEGILDEIGFRLEQNPQKSLRRLVQEGGVSNTSVHHATKLFKLKPYKTNTENK